MSALKRRQQRSRNQDTRRKIVLGSLVIATGADQIPQDALIGILLAGLRDVGQRPELIHQFAIGGAKFMASRPSAGKTRLVIVKFPFAPDETVRASLTKLGMTYDEAQRRWYGRAHPQAVEQVAAAGGGFVELVDQTPR